MLSLSPGSGRALRGFTHPGLDPLEPVDDVRELIGGDVGGLSLVLLLTRASDERTGDRRRDHRDEPDAEQHDERSDESSDRRDLGSFYDPALDTGCAFEELISFHGGIGGPQTRAFILHPAELEVPAEELVGAAAVHGVLAGWRAQLNGANSSTASGSRSASGSC